METKNGKQYLPQTYEAFMALRKKPAKGNIILSKAMSNSENNHVPNFSF